MLYTHFAFLLHAQSQNLCRLKCQVLCFLTLLPQVYLSKIYTVNQILKESEKREKTIKFQKKCLTKGIKNSKKHNFLLKKYEKD